jgi:carbon storage regulator CsrA
MLVLTRKLEQCVCLVDKATGKKIAEIVFLSMDRNKIRLGFNAENSIEIWRGEIAPGHVHEQAPPSPGPYTPDPGVSDHRTAAGPGPDQS